MLLKHICLGATSEYYPRESYLCFISTRTYNPFGPHRLSKHTNHCVIRLWTKRQFLCFGSSPARRLWTKRQFCVLGSVPLVGCEQNGSFVFWVQSRSSAVNKKVVLCFGSSPACRLWTKRKFCVLGLVPLVSCEQNDSFVFWVPSRSSAVNKMVVLCFGSSPARRLWTKWQFCVLGLVPLVSCEQNGSFPADIVDTLVLNFVRYLKLIGNCSYNSFRHKLRRYALVSKLLCVAGGTGGPYWGWEGMWGVKICIDTRYPSPWFWLLNTLITKHKQRAWR